MFATYSKSSIGSRLKQSFDRYHAIAIPFWQEMAGLGEVIEVKPETSIKEPFKVEHHLNFILEGSGGILLWNNNQFVCTDLVLNDDFLCDYLSLLTQQATPYQVVTFEACALLRIPVQRLNRFLDKHPHGERFRRHAAEALYVDKHLQYIQSATASPSSIYSLIMSHQPEIIRRIPQKYIASFLGITPQSLSRIRKRLKEEVTRR